MTTVANSERTETNEQPLRNGALAVLSFSGRVAIGYAAIGSETLQALGQRCRRRVLSLGGLFGGTSGSSSPAPNAWPSRSNWAAMARTALSNSYRPRDLA